MTEPIAKLLYEAHDAATKGPGTPWGDLSHREQRAWDLVEVCARNAAGATQVTLGLGTATIAAGLRPDSTGAVVIRAGEAAVPVGTPLPLGGRPLRTDDIVILLANRTAIASLRKAVGALDKLMPPEPTSVPTTSLSMSALVPHPTPAKVVEKYRRHKRRIVPRDL